MTVKIMGWKPPQRPQWVKEIMRIPGPMRVQLLLLATLTISSVSSTVLLISNRVSNTSDASTLPVVESLEVAKVNGELRLRVTGNATTEVLQNLKMTLKNLDAQLLNEK